MAGCRTTALIIVLAFKSIYDPVYIQITRRHKREFNTTFPFIVMCNDSVIETSLCYLILWTLDIYLLFTSKPCDGRLVYVKYDGTDRSPDCII